MVSTAEVVAAFARFISGARPRWTGCRPEPKQRIYFANHTSHLDAVVLWALLPPTLRSHTRPVAARDYWLAGPIRRHLAVRCFRAVLVDRVPQFHQHPLELLDRALDEGDSLILFPEGGRLRAAQMSDFRPGLWHLAEGHPAVELIPVYLRYFDRVLPRGAHFPVPLLTDVVFGAPFERRAEEGRDAFLARAREAVLRLGAS
jgi:1-acyl-sn-glycerol-3-phosphate acyltransferase